MRTELLANSERDADADRDVVRQPGSVAILRVSLRVSPMANAGVCVGVVDTVSHRQLLHYGQVEAEISSCSRHVREEEGRLVRVGGFV